MWYIVINFLQELCKTPLYKKEKNSIRPNQQDLVELTNTYVKFNYETFLPWLQMQIVAHNKDNEMCASISLVVVILSQCFFKENVHTWFFFAFECLLF